MHNVVLNQDHPCYLMRQPTPYVGFDKDGLYVGICSYSEGHDYYMSIPLSEDELKNVILFAKVALCIKQMRIHYDDRVDWTRLQIWGNFDDLFAILAINEGSGLTDEAFADCVIVHTNSLSMSEGAMRRFDRKSIREWIPAAKMDPMKYTE